MNYAAYTLAIKEQLAVHRHILDQLNSQQRPYTPIERAAAERSLQLLVESLIGCAKHLNSHLKLPARNDAYQTITQLAEHQQLPAEALPELKGAIGMRNAIVHDYLNLDWDKIQTVIQQQKYRLLEQIALQLCKQLEDS